MLSADGRELDEAQQRFAVAEGDLITYLNIWKAWDEAGRSARWCGNNFIHHHNMLRAASIRNQLAAKLKRLGFRFASCGRDIGLVLQAITAGMFLNAAQYEGLEYNPMRGTQDPGTSKYR